MLLINSEAGSILLNFKFRKFFAVTFASWLLSPLLTAPVHNAGPCASSVYFVYNWKGCERAIMNERWRFTSSFFSHGPPPINNNNNNKRNRQAQLHLFMCWTITRRTSYTAHRLSQRVTRHLPRPDVTSRRTYAHTLSIGRRASF